MITTRAAPRTRRLLVAAFAVSLLAHLFGGALWAHGSQLVDRIMHRLPAQHQLEQQVATSDVIHLEQRTVPRPAELHRSRSQRRLRPHPMKNVHAQPRAAAVSVANVESPAPQRRPAPVGWPKIAGRSRSAKASKASLSAQRIAQLNAQFSRTIAATHVDLATIQKQSEERPVATKRYPLQFAGIQANLTRGEGYISPTTVGQRSGGSVWYYTHYTYMWPDGHIEDDDIPWPFRFPVQRDLFALHVRLIPLQLPPPGFHLSRALKPFLAHFLRRAGAD